jgi:hypothetical protein
VPGETLGEPEGVVVTVPVCDCVEVGVGVVLAVLVALLAAERDALTPRVRVTVIVAVRLPVTDGVCVEVLVTVGATVAEWVGETVDVPVSDNDADAVLEAEGVPEGVWESGAPTRQTSRTRLLELELPTATNKLPRPSTATVAALTRLGASLALPSNANETATVVSAPVTTETIRTRALSRSAMKTLPAASTATPDGLCRVARGALLAPIPAVSRAPANVESTPPAAMRITWRLGSAMNRRPVASTAMLAGPDSRAMVAAQPSPQSPPPATVKIAPVGETARTNPFPVSAM